ncbi:MAG TPA: carboxynorspermidine decarboxylase, partial [Nitratifractor sp.]|nr:carboxynorspermidine decarboxylase [Nitratifractor sp.]
IKEKTGVKILLALKGYALWKSFDTVREYLDGCCASGLHEALLAKEEFQKEVHTYSPAFKEEELEEIAKISNHLVFNSAHQLQEFANKAKEINPKISLGLRVNPETSVAPAEIYNPCGVYSRLGIKADDFKEEFLEQIDGLHFHALCEEDSNSLEKVLQAFEEKFGKYLNQLRWVNFGGGHHITKKGYNIDLLTILLQNFQKKYPHLQIYLEPGEAVGWQTGSLIATVLDIVHNGVDIAILDTSAEAHMPDTIIMPYRAEVRGAKEPNTLPYTYRLAGNTCLAGDIMGDYSFNSPLKRGDKIIFEDQMHYTMVKATTFNGIKLPSIAILKENSTVEVLREFGYEDFKNRLS